MYSKKSNCGKINLSYAILENENRIKFTVEALDTEGGLKFMWGFRVGGSIGLDGNGLMPYEGKQTLTIDASGFDEFNEKGGIFYSKKSH